MNKTVLEKVSERCRDALIGGVPIVYIKTDSLSLIKSVVYNMDHPLVVPIKAEFRDDAESRRPVSELLERGSVVQDKQIMNIKNGLFSAGGKDYDLLLYPTLWFYKIPDHATPADAASVFNRMERYVIDRNDKNFPSYDMLQSSLIILYSSEVCLSPALEVYTEIIEVDLPEAEEIRRIIAEETDDREFLENTDLIKKIVNNFMGFSVDEIRLTIRKIVTMIPLTDESRIMKAIADRKRQKMEGGILEHCSANGNIGGMDNFRRWLEDQIEPLKNESTYRENVGTPPPKGVLLCGIPGCGKSEAARFTAQQLDLPLLKMDMGSLMDKYQGVSEQRMREALKLAEAMSPCVLWIDELEKGFSGAGSDNNDSSFQRMFGYMLGWMQDNQKPCFIFATANNIGGLPKEFFRSGRFDALFAVYLPTAAECADIFKACVKKAKKNIARVRGIDEDEVDILDESCMETELYLRLINRRLVTAAGAPRIVIGSDIQKVVNIALRSLVNENRITAEKWEYALEVALSPSNCRLYGDGEENVDSIAISYCRMLRKSFNPTADIQNVLFDTKDYHPGNLPMLERLMRVPTSNMTDEEKAEHEKKLSDCRIMSEKRKRFDHKYDDAVYRYILTRINEVAPLLEKKERDQMIMR